MRSPLAKPYRVAVLLADVTLEGQDAVFHREAAALPRGSRPSSSFNATPRSPCSTPRRRRSSPSTATTSRAARIAARGLTTRSTARLAATSCCGSSSSSPPGAPRTSSCARSATACRSCSSRRRAGSVISSTRCSPRGRTRASSAGSRAARRPRRATTCSRRSACWRRCSSSRRGSAASAPTIRRPSPSRTTRRARPRCASTARRSSPTSTSTTRRAASRCGWSPNRLPAAWKVAALRLVELALGDDLGDAILAIDPEHPQALLRANQRHGDPVVLRRVLASAPGWAAPHVALDGNAAASDADELERLAGVGFAALCRPGSLDVCEVAARRLGRRRPRRRGRAAAAAAGRRPPAMAQSDAAGRREPGRGAARSSRAARAARAHRPRRRCNTFAQALDSLEQHGSGEVSAPPSCPRSRSSCASRRRSPPSAAATRRSRSRRAGRLVDHELAFPRRRAPAGRLARRRGGRSPRAAARALAAHRGPDDAP